MSNTISLTPAEPIVLVEHPIGRLEVHFYVGYARVMWRDNGDLPMRIGTLRGGHLQLQRFDTIHLADLLGVPLLEIDAYVVKLLRLAGVEASL